MILNRPVLLFVAGPQKGQHVVLRDNRVLLGRTAQAGVPLQEEHASREQAWLSLTSDGWILENASTAGTWINGKRFKSDKKKVLLDTGDVIEVGRETQLLFVSAGEDPQQALSEWLRKNPPPVESPPKPVPEPSAQSKVAPAKRRLFGFRNNSDSPEKEKPPAVATAEPRKGLSKQKKYLIFAMIYLVAMAGFFAVLWQIKQKVRQERVLTTSLQRLSDSQISETLSLIPRRSPDPTRMAAELRKALALYETLPGDMGDLYRCVRAFQYYQAYKGSEVFDRVQDERKYRGALNDLIRQVTEHYRSAWAWEQSGDWSRAMKAFRNIEEMLPEPDSGNPVNDRLLKNVRDHIAYVGAKSRQGSRRRR